MPKPQLILASTSIYRQALLEKLGIEFQCLAPDCDEDAVKMQIRDPIELARRLAHLKAESLAGAQRCIIGGDQVAALDDEILGKPKTFEKAEAQLLKLQGRTHRLITAIHIIFENQHYPILDITTLQMKSLTRQQIRAYLRKDEPLDCAASYKIEKSGLALMEKIDCQDFSAIQGLPLMQVSKVLEGLGYALFSAEDKK